jgi:hypothetical protein
VSCKSKLPVLDWTAAEAANLLLNCLNHIRLFRDIPELKAQVTSLCKRQFLPVLRRGPFGRTVPVQKALLFPALTSILFQAGLAFNEW